MLKNIIFEHAAVWCGTQNPHERISTFRFLRAIRLAWHHKYYIFGGLEFCNE